MTVIIAALNEEETIGPSVDSAFAAGAGEVIVVDGGSVDRTPAIAAARGANVLQSDPPRARQFNFGAASAVHDYLIFLHADTTLPAAAAGTVTESQADFGGFRVRFAERALKLRVAAFMINLRTAITRCPWGDQAQFIRRSVFLADGGFRDIPIMEDYELAMRMKRRGRNAVLPLTVITSGRRFLQKGLIRTALTNWRIIISYRLGMAPERLAAIYRR